MPNTLVCAPEDAYNGRLEDPHMKSDIHPKYQDINVTCACGNKFVTRSTLGRDLSLEVCSECHPFYTGKQKIVDTAGRVDRFKQKYATAAKKEASNAEEAK